MGGEFVTEAANAPEQPRLVVVYFDLAAEAANLHRKYLIAGIGAISPDVLDDPTRSQRLPAMASKKAEQVERFAEIVVRLKSALTSHDFE